MQGAALLSRHAFERMFQRGIDPSAVARIVAEAEIVYPDDQPFPSTLLLGFYGKQAIHAIASAVDAGGSGEGKVSDIGIRQHKPRKFLDNFI